MASDQATCRTESHLRRSRHQRHRGHAFAARTEVHAGLVAAHTQRFAGADAGCRLHRGRTCRADAVDADAGAVGTRAQDGDLGGADLLGGASDVGLDLGSRQRGHVPGSTSVRAHVGLDVEQVGARVVGAEVDVTAGRSGGAQVDDGARGKRHGSEGSQARGCHQFGHGSSSLKDRDTKEGGMKKENLESTPRSIRDTTSSCHLRKTSRDVSLRKELGELSKVAPKCGL